MKKLLIFVSLLLSSCSTQYSSGAENVVNVHARFVNPKEDAERAIAAGDFRLFVVVGYAAEIPGSKLSISEGERRYGLRKIEGVSDNWKNEQDAALYRDAVRYAEIYNKTIIHYRE